MPSETTFTFDSDDFALTGTLHLPDRQNPPVVIGCHGLLANRHSVKQISLAKACNREGVAYFRFDHRGCGDSHGRFAEVTSLAARVNDLKDAIATLERRPDLGPPAALFGSSFGGTVVLEYAVQYGNPCALVTYAAPINSASIRRASIRDNNGEAPSAALLTESMAFDITPGLESLHDILVAHSENDETVPVDHAKEIYRSAGDRKKLIIFPGGDHCMSHAAHQQEFEVRFIEWISTCGR
ncbi:MAG: alpha/beta fold hydrolase [Desulfobacteraceae bacterium]